MSSTDGAPAAATPAVVPESIAREAMIAWYRGEFAAANAIIDALCGHLMQLADDGSEYEGVFLAIHRRRMNWLPVLHMQKYFSIADVAAELRQVGLKRPPPPSPSPPIVAVDGGEEIKSGFPTEIDEGETENPSPDSPDQKVLEGSQSSNPSSDNLQSLCSDHDDCTTRPTRIKTSRGFIAKEPVKGHMVNVVKGLKLYEDVFTDSELRKLVEFINELRLAGQRGDLSGETFVCFNQQLKGNRKEMIQLGVPIFQSADESTGHIEPLPSVLQGVIDHLVQWHLIPESRKPNSCIINFFDEDECSQPYFKPPHLDLPISTLLLSDTDMAFGRVIVSDPQGNFRGSLMLSLKEGSLLVMRGNSADMARHVICPSSNRRVAVTFVRVRPSSAIAISQPEAPLASGAMTVWQPPPPGRMMMIPYKMPNMNSLSYFGAQPMDVVPGWGPTSTMFMLPPTMTRPIVMGGSTKRVSEQGGTGVFLPWAMNPPNKKYTKHLPPRIQRGRQQQKHNHKHHHHHHQMLPTSPSEAAAA
ncbi:hypothetical protein QJS10_CPA16g01464 [Acorus calamus]|uniref:Fe2OG dioxygenase domain-containing protein n=1 Tax=Acorus calamus TaxID=4465 RepID=A0AAV9D083_ACOCL|nr:hypothetical protein QJS10_CPA16g01464 [Acorus calamus]